MPGLRFSTPTATPSWSSGTRAQSWATSTFGPKDYDIAPLSVWSRSRLMIW